jgi:hypothetical protein
VAGNSIIARKRGAARIYKRQAMLIRRPPSAVFSMFRQHMLAAFMQWITDSRPTRAEIDAEITATVSAMRQISEVM